jgi:hypothetical protein
MALEMVDDPQDNSDNGGSGGGFSSGGRGVLGSVLFSIFCHLYSDCFVVGANAIDKNKVVGWVVKIDKQLNIGTR